MQIWRTTWSAPRSSHMKIRLVRLRCFLLTMLPQKSLVASLIWSILFHTPCTFLCSWMPAEASEIFHSRESVFSLAPLFASEGKPNRYGRPLGRQQGCVAWKRGWSGLNVFFWQCFLREVLLHRQFGPFCFALPACFCVLECHKRRVKSSTAESVFSSVSLFAFEGKPKRWRQGVQDRQKNCLRSGWKTLENVQVNALSSKLLPFAICFHWFQQQVSSFAWLLITP